MRAMTGAWCRRLITSSSRFSISWLTSQHKNWRGLRERSLKLLSRSTSTRRIFSTTWYITLAFYNGIILSVSCSNVTASLEIVSCLKTVLRQFWMSWSWSLSWGLLSWSWSWVTHGVLVLELLSWSNEQDWVWQPGSAIRTLWLHISEPASLAKPFLIIYADQEYLVIQSINQSITFAMAPVTDDHWRRTRLQVT